MATLAWILGFIPGIIWLAFVWAKDEHEPEPIGWVALVFFVGALAVIPAWFIERFLAVFLEIEFIDTGAKAASASWLVAGIVEEAIKLAVVLGVVYFRDGFNEPMDGIVYAAAAALGFACAENIVYVKAFGPEIILVRGALTTLGHMLFSSVWGYALGRTKFSASGRLELLTKGFVLSAFLHGLYNFLVFTKVCASFGVFLVVGFMWQMLVRMIREAEARSPFASD